MTTTKPQPVATELPVLHLDEHAAIEPTQDGEPSRRAFSRWDALGLLLATSVMLSVNQRIVVHMDVPLGRSPEIRAATVAGWLAVGAGLLALLVIDRPGPRTIPRRLTAVWRDPPADWVPFVLGALVAMPLLGLYSPILFYDSDSARIVASVRYVQQGHLGYLAETQEVLLPHAIFGAAFSLGGGLGAAKLYAILSIQALAGVVAFLTHRVTRQMWAAAAAALSLLCLSPVLERARHLPMYPTMLVFGYLGGWFGYRVISGASRPWANAAGSALCITLAVEAHGIGKLFLAVPALLVVFAPSLRAAVVGEARLYGAVLVGVLPRVVINLADGGTAWFRTPRSDYWVTKGYLDAIQTNFWGYDGVNEGLREYVSQIPGRFYEGLGPWGWLILSGAVIGWLLCCRGRSRVFVFGVVAFLLLAITVKQIPSFDRYYAPFWPGLAVLAGVVVAALLRRHKSPPVASWLRVGAAVCMLALVAGAWRSYSATVDETERLRARTESLPARAIVAEIGDSGKGVIGARAHHLLLSVTADIPTWGDQFLTEDEYVTYLTWPSDKDVVEVLERHDIGWVLVHANRDLEVRYNDSWLVPYYGQQARHVDAVLSSPYFCRRLATRGFVLYELGRCSEPAGSLVATTT